MIESGARDQTPRSILVVVRFQKRVANLCPESRARSYQLPLNPP